MQSRVSITLSILSSEVPLEFRCPVSLKTSIIFSQVLERLEMVLKAARLQIKQYMGECRFLFRITATTTRRFSLRLTTPMMRKISMGICTSWQSVGSLVLLVMMDGLKSRAWIEIILPLISVFNTLKEAITHYQYFKYVTLI